MARKTDGEKIDELVILATSLNERLSAVHKEIEGLPGLTTKVAPLEQQCSKLRLRAEEASRRRWSLIPAVVSSVLGGVIALACQAAKRLSLGVL